MGRAKKFWLMKSEPGDYSIDDLARDGSVPWSGVRNYQARNFMRDDMAEGDLVLFYHSNAEPPGVAGIGRIVGDAQMDGTAWQPQSPSFDPKAKRGDTVWMLRQVAFVEKFSRLVRLEDLRSDPALAGLLVLRRGMRLSIQPVEAVHFDRICALARA